MRGGVGSTEPKSGVEMGELPPEGVQRMFDRIAPVYDLMNYVMTAGLDGLWRRITVEQTKAERWNGQLPSAIYAGAPIPFLNVK